MESRSCVFTEPVCREALGLGCSSCRFLRRVQGSVHSVQGLGSAESGHRVDNAALLGSLPFLPIDRNSIPNASC